MEKWVEAHPHTRCHQRSIEAQPVRTRWAYPKKSVCK